MADSKQIKINPDDEPCNYNETKDVIRITIGVQVDPMGPVEYFLFWIRLPEAFFLKRVLEVDRAVVAQIWNIEPHWVSWILLTLETS
jgi:hypothetical protein